MSKQEEGGGCSVCGEPAQETCALCELTVYCGPDHQRQHWATHRARCRPYRIAQSLQLGRYLVATRDLKAGELLLRERPLALGPRAGATPPLRLCLTCWRPLPVPPPRCPGCSVAPLCPGGTCCHDDAECSALREAGPTADWSLSADMVLPLRCLLLAQTQHEQWQRLLHLEAHMECRGPGTAVWSRNYATVVQPLREAGLLKDGEEAVQRVCGVLDVNSFEVRAPQAEQQAEQAEQLRALYSQAALMAHDCVANTHLAVDDQFVMTVHAALPIPEGAAICFNYTSALLSTEERREHLREGKYFECVCARCRDPTELGTHLSSLRCPRCRQGLVCVDPEHPLAWRCGGCGRAFSSSMVRCALWSARDLAEAALSEAVDPRALEVVLRRLSHSLAPNHALLVQLRQQLAGLYRAAAASAPSVPRRLLARQVELCRGLLPLLAVIEPGISRLRGIALYELQGPLAELARREYAAGDLGVQQLVERLEEAERALKDAVAALLFESALSPEGRLARAAMLELRDLRDEILELRTEVEQQQPQRRDRRRRK